MSQVESRSKRRRSVVHAVGASLLSKGSTSILQFVSLPIAARVLGREEFGIYATISVSLFLLNLLQIGVGPALARGIAEASAKSDHGQERRLYYTGAFLVIALAFVGLIVAALLISFVPVSILFGDKYASWEPVLIPSLWTGAGLLALDLIARHTDRVREGYMEAGVAMAWVAAGNFIGAIAVIAGVHFFPSPVFLLLAVFVPNILVRLINTGFLLRKRPWLIRPLCYPTHHEMKDMLKDGFFFSSTSTVVHLVEFNLCALIIGRFLGPSEVAIHFVLVMIATAFEGFLIMVGNPLWAAIVDAKTKGDQEWLLAATKRYYQFLAALAGLAGITLIGFGPWLIPLLYGSEFSADRLLFIGHAVFLFAIGWRHVNRCLSIGLGFLPRTVIPILAGVTVGFILGMIGLRSFGLWTLYAGLGLGTLLIPGLILPRMVWDETGMKKILPIKSLTRSMIRFSGLPVGLQEKLLFFGKCRYWPNFTQPRSFNEKINWRKLYSTNQLYAFCSHKFLVRDYVKEKVGDHILIPLLFEGDNITEEQILALGDNIVVKATHDSGSACIIRENTPEEAARTCRQIEQKLKINYGKNSREWWYTSYPPKVIVEKFIGHENESQPSDIKFLMFGRPRDQEKAYFIEVDYDRGSTRHSTVYDQDGEIYRIDGTLISFDSVPNHEIPFPCPEALPELRKIAETLADDFDHVRVDLYHQAGKTYFGELSFSDGGGRTCWSPREFDFEMGALWDLQSKRECPETIAPTKLPNTQPDYTRLGTNPPTT